MACTPAVLALPSSADPAVVALVDFADSDSLPCWGEETRKYAAEFVAPSVVVAAAMKVAAGAECLVVAADMVAAVLGTAAVAGSTVGTSAEKSWAAAAVGVAEKQKEHTTIPKAIAWDSDSYLLLHHHHHLAWMTTCCRHTTN